VHLLFNRLREWENVKFRVSSCEDTKVTYGFSIEQGAPVARRVHEVLWDMGSKVVNEDVEMPVGMRRITLIPVMSFVGAKWLRTSKGRILPDWKAHPFAREEEGDPNMRVLRIKRRGALIKINSGHSYFHKLSALGLFVSERVGARLKASALSRGLVPK